MDILFSEPFLEAVPTTFILVTIFVRNLDTDGNLFSQDEYNFLGINKFSMFGITLFISIFSGSFGMAKFLKLGPCQIVQSDKIHCGFIMVILSIATTLFSKALVLACSLLIVNKTLREFYLILCVIWICSCILPQLLFVSTNPILPPPF